MNLFVAPIYSFFSSAAYRLARRWSVGKAFGYLAYLAGIGALIVLLLIVGKAFPQMDAFVTWMKGDMPLMTLTGEGLQMDIQSTYTMAHPDYGTIATFDANRTEITVNDMGDALIYVTSQKAYVRQGVGELRVYDLTQALTQAAAQPGGQNVANQRVDITPETIDRIYSSLKPWVVVVGILFYFLFFLVWKAVAALFYSLIGLILNLKAPAKSSFANLYVLSIYAMTPVCVIQWLRFFVPAVNAVPFLWALINTGLTTTFLYLALFKWSDAAASPSVSEDSQPAS